MKNFSLGLVAGLTIAIGSSAFAQCRGGSKLSAVNIFMVDTGRIVHCVELEIGKAGDSMTCIR